MFPHEFFGVLLEEEFGQQIFHFPVSFYPVFVSLVLLRLYAYLDSLLDLDVYYQKIIYAREKLTFDKIKAKKFPAAYRRSKKAGMKPAMEYKKIPAGGAGTKKAARAG